MGNIETLRPFKKGGDERRHTGGKGSTKFLTAMLTKNLKAKKEITVEGIDIVTGKPTKIKVPMPTKEVIIHALLRQAAKGNMVAIKEVFDRTEGKSPQPLVGKDGEDINLNVNGESAALLKKIAEKMNGTNTG